MSTANRTAPVPKAPGPAVPEPGTLHSDPVLAALGWRTCEHLGHGLYIRRPEPQPGREAGD